MVGKVGVPENCVVDTSFFPGEVGQDGVETPVVAVAGPHKTLRVAAVSIVGLFIPPDVVQTPLPGTSLRKACIYLLNKRFGGVLRHLGRLEASAGG